VRTALAFAVLACATARASAQESGEIALVTSGCDPTWIETALVPALRIESGRDVRLVDATSALGTFVRIVCDRDAVVVERGRISTFEARPIDLSDVEGPNRDRTLALVLTDLANAERDVSREIATEPDDTRAEVPLGSPGLAPPIQPARVVPPPPQRRDSDRALEVSNAAESGPVFDFSLGFLFETDLLLAELNALYGFAVRGEFHLRALEPLALVVALAALRGSVDDRAGTITTSVVRGAFGFALGRHTGEVRPSVSLELRPGWLHVSGEASAPTVTAVERDRALVDAAAMGRLHVVLAGVAVAVLELGLTAVIVGFEARADDRSVFDLRGFALSGRAGLSIAFE
jgi:hypothetical protein